MAYMIYSLITWPNLDYRKPRLLSVQFVLTPGLHLVPGIYAKPGFCQIILKLLGVSEQFLNGISAQYRLCSRIAILLKLQFVNFCGQCISHYGRQLLQKVNSCCLE